MLMKSPTAHPNGRGGPRCSGVDIKVLVSVGLLNAAAAGKQPWATACQTSGRRPPGAAAPQTSVAADPRGAGATYANIARRC